MVTMFDASFGTLGLHPAHFLAHSLSPVSLSFSSHSTTLPPPIDSRLRSLCPPAPTPRAPAPRTCGHCTSAAIFTPVGRGAPSRTVSQIVGRRRPSWVVLVVPAPRPDSGARGGGADASRCLSLLDGWTTTTAAGGRAGRGAFSRGASLASRRWDGGSAPVLSPLRYSPLVVLPCWCRISAAHFAVE